MKLVNAFVIPALLVILTATAGSQTVLRAGVAKVDITPPPGLPMWGYELRQSTGTLDPLFARVLVLEAGDVRLGLVTLDLGRTFGSTSIEKIQNMASRTSGISYVLLAASHDHSGPVIQNPSSPSNTITWEQATLEKIARAIDDAHRHAVEARIGVGYGVSYIGHNRLRVEADGTVGFFEKNQNQVPTSPIDPTVSVLRVDSADGSPLAILVGYACHPVIFGPDNQQYSTDYPGVVAETVEEAFHRKPLCLFLQGAAGDINPYYAVTSLAQDALKWRDWTGTRLGDEAVRVARQIRTASSTQPSIDFRETLLNFHFRWDPEKFHEAFLASSEIRSAEERQPYLDAYGPSSPGSDQRLTVGTILINKQIAIMAVPGEAFVNFQVDWRNRCPVRDCLFAGYANGYNGYFPTLRAATLGGYGGGGFMTWLEPGAGDRMVDAAIVNVYQMLGRLNDDPR